MPTYLLKTEPGEFSFADLVSAGRSVWDGVENPEACNHLRTIAKGDEVLIYHTGSEKAVVGLARVTRGSFADPARAEERTGDGRVKFPVVELEAVALGTAPATLAWMKADPRFEGFALLTRARLSVMPVPAALDAAIRAKAGLPATTH